MVAQPLHDIVYLIIRAARFECALSLQDIALQFTMDEPLLLELSHLLGVSKEHFADRLDVRPQLGTTRLPALT
jgi:hypothetical protein